MDITITGAEMDESGRYIHVHRTLRDGTDERLMIEKMPCETLGIRAAEYDLDVDDPVVLDLVLLEGFYRPEDPDEVHPLFSADSVAQAYRVMRDRLEVVRTQHGAPEFPNRLMASAVANGNASDGLVRARALLLEHSTPPGLREHVQVLRDAERGRWAERRRRTGRPSLVDLLGQQARRVHQAEISDLPKPAQDPVNDSATMPIQAGD